MELDKPGRPLSETARPAGNFQGPFKDRVTDGVKNRKPSSLLRNGVPRCVHVLHLRQELHVLTGGRMQRDPHYLLATQQTCVKEVKLTSWSRTVRTPMPT